MIPGPGPVIGPLYGAYESLLQARQKRGTLELDLAERRIVMNDDGTVQSIEARARLDSHRLIEEFMVTANIAAAKRLEALRQPCMYRIHDQPDPVKIEALREIMETIGLRLARGQVIRPGALTALLAKAQGTPVAAMVSGLVLRAQSQAVYSPGNIGHFGLALTHYAHFTSPIRRYADLLVHRALIAGLKPDDGALPAEAGARFAEIGEHISTTERRAAAAERDAVDRFTAAFLRDRVGAVFRGAINGVTRFGLFVTLDETGADGLVPMSLLPDDYYDYDEAGHRLIGRRWGRSYHLGEAVTVRLMEAVPVTGGLILQPVEDSSEVSATGAPGAVTENWHPLDGKTHRRRAGGPAAKAAERDEPAPRKGPAKHRRRARKPRG